METEQINIQQLPLQPIPHDHCETTKHSNVIVGNTYRLIKKLGQGSFGEIHLGVHNLTGQKVAIKIQLQANSRHQLKPQYKLLSSLSHEVDPCYRTDFPGIPKIYQFYEEPDKNVMILELLGPSLEDLFTFCGKRFSLKTTLMVGMQMIDLLEFIHSKDVIHRDIKPDNFLIGCEEHMNKIYMIDFGLARRYKNKDNQHIAYRDNKNLIGTARYVSINTHIGIQQSRRDDLESLIYVLLYFLKGSLPWQNLKANDKRYKYEKIMERKLCVSLSHLCSGVPKEFQEILKYARGLHFEHQIDYVYLKKRLNRVFEREKYEKDWRYDWIVQAEQKRIALWQIQKQRNNTTSCDIQF